MGVINKYTHIRKYDSENTLLVFEKTNIEDILKGFKYTCKKGGGVAYWYVFSEANEYVMAMFILEKEYEVNIKVFQR